MRIACTFLPCLAVAVSAPVGAAQQTARVSVDSNGVEGNRGGGNDSEGTGVAISADGRFVAFWSASHNLVPNDKNSAADIFLRDRRAGTTERVSVNSAGNESNSPSHGPSITPDGRFIAFDSWATNLASNDVNNLPDIYVRDRQLGTTELASVDSTGTLGNSDSQRPSISADGRFVAFDSFASNLVAGDTNFAFDVFVHDRQTGTTECVSVDAAGAVGDYGSYSAKISADGRFVSFESGATTLVPGDTNAHADVFVRDRQSGTTERVSVDSSGAQGNGTSYQSAISADGRFVAFQSSSDNLVAGDTNRVKDVFVRDRQAGTTERVSLRTTGKEQFKDSLVPSISADGRFVSFISTAPFVGDDTNGVYDVFVRDRQKSRTTRASVDSAGNEGDAAATYSAQLSADGRFVAFGSSADDLVSGDTNGDADAFIHGPWLTLEANPPAPTAGATLTFDTWTGAANGPSLLVAVDLNGTSLFLPVMAGSFDAAGVWSFSAVVPPGLSGNVAGFVAFGIVPTGKVDLSNRFDVSFQ